MADEKVFILNLYVAIIYLVSDRLMKDTGRWSDNSGSGGYFVGKC